MLDQLKAFDKIKAFYKLGRNLSFADVQSLVKAASTKSFKQGACLISSGSLDREVYFIRKGLVRAYQINDKGDEITIMLRAEHQIVASPRAILFNQNSQFYFEAFEDTDVFCINYDKLQDVIANNPKLEANRKHVLLNLLKEATDRVESFVLLTPEERYLAYMDRYPDIVRRVPNKYIANVLGLTPVSLSRIRKRISDKKR